LAEARVRRVQLLDHERARLRPRTSVDALRAARRRGHVGARHVGARGRRAELAQLTNRLEPFGERHVSGLEAILDDPDLLRFTRLPEPVPPDFARAWLARYDEGAATEREAFAIVDDDDDGFLGLALAPQIDRETLTAELGYVVAPAARGRGVASEALRRLTEWAVTELGMFRLELLISVDNAASQRVAEKCGYVREGVLRSFHVKQDVREDTEIWSRLATDP
jgi:RimJ/RimL family protein N-acetyltransferase